MTLSNNEESPMDRLEAMRKNNNAGNEFGGMIKNTPSELLKRSELKKGKDESKKTVEESKGIFGKDGVSRGRLREALRKEYDPNVSINAEKRVALEKEMPWSKYGDNISEKDINTHLKSLRKERFRTPYSKDKHKIGEKIKIFERLKNKEK